MDGDRYETGRLSFALRPASGAPGERDEPLGLDTGRDGQLYVPETADPGAPLLVFLHGAAGTGRAHLPRRARGRRPLRRNPRGSGLTRADLGPHRRAPLRSRRRLPRPGPRHRRRSGRCRHRAAGDRRGVRRCVVRPVHRADQRGRAPYRARLLTRLPGRALPDRGAPDLHLARPGRSDPADRRLQPVVRTLAARCRLRGELP